jgi:DNA-binding NtrC family response regulator
MAEAQAAWLLAIADLDARVGEASLAQLMAESKRLIERRFMAAAVTRTQGDVSAAAALLHIAVEELVQALARGDAASTSVSATIV